MLALLPAGSGQHARVQEKVQALSALVSASPSAPGGGGATATGAARRTGWGKWAAGAGAVGVLLLKFKWVLLFLLTKAKVLLVGLTQAKTFLSMALALGVSLRKPGVYTLNAAGRPAEAADTASARKFASKAVFALVLCAKSAMFSIAVALFAQLSP